MLVLGHSFNLIQKIERILLRPTHRHSPRRVFAIAVQHFLSCLDSELAHVKQLHDALDNLDVRRGVAALVADSGGFKLVKLFFPVAQCVDMHAEHFGDLADFVVGLVVLFCIKYPVLRHCLFAFVFWLQVHFF